MLRTNYRRLGVSRSIASAYRALRFTSTIISVLLLATPLGAHAAPGSPCLAAPALPAPTGNTVNVSNASQLRTAISNLTANTTIVLAPGEYVLSSTLYIRRNNVTIIGQTDSCEDSILIGNGMDNADYGSVPHGIWSDADNLTIANLTIRDVYYHTIIFNFGAQSPLIYNVKLLNSGQQFIKSNPSGYGNGVDNGRVEYTIMEYPDAPTNHSGSSTGYTNGVDVHAGENWVIRNNLFKNFHTPDSADYLWNPAILMWNGASGTIAEGNRFVDVDRAIAFGLIDRADPDHFGGIIRNNMIYYSPGLYSSSRTGSSDASILVWDSPQTKVLHNTILTNGNLNDAMQVRFASTGVEIRNNLVDNSIRSRGGAQYVSSDNMTNANSEMFIDPSNGDLHLKPTALEAMNQVKQLADAPMDIDGHNRQSIMSDVGADEFVHLDPTCIPHPTGL